MRLSSSSFANGSPIPAGFALGAPHPDTCALLEEITGADVRQALEGDVLPQAAITSTYSPNPGVPA